MKLRNNQQGWMVVAHAFKSQHSGGGDRQISEVEASLVYRASSRSYTEKLCLEKPKIKIKIMRKN